MDECPICFEELGESIENCAMPLCHHKVHVRCLLQAAQYDLRCPICRCKDPHIIEKKTDGEEQMSYIENLFERHQIATKQYQRKRSRLISKNSNMQKIRDQLKEVNKKFIAAQRQ